MEQFDTYDVVKKLIGHINPVGESHTDEKRLDNLHETINLMKCLMNDIIDVAKKHDRHEHSVAECGKTAKEYLDFIKRLLD